MRQLSRSDIANIQLELLDSLAKFCDQHGLRYFLAAGTLLGAVRHKGYIPWDDDIDVALFREDYMELSRIFVDDRYRLYSLYNTDWYALPFIKIADTTTTQIEESDLFGKHEIGVNIDVFPLDICPESPNAQQDIFKAIRRRRRILDFKGVRLSVKRSPIRNIALIGGKLVFSMVNASRLSRSIDTLAQKYADSGYHNRAELVWGYGMREIVDESIFDVSVSVKFEGRTFAAPGGYHEWLEHTYGNYLELPPLEKRHTHHSYCAYSKGNLESPSQTLSG